MKYWIKAVSGDVVLAVFLYAWLALDIEGAGRVSVFFLWAIAILRILIGMVADKSMFKSMRPKGFGVYHGATDVAVIAVLVWFGHPWLAGFLATGYLMQEAAREREPKAKKEAA